MLLTLLLPNLGMGASPFVTVVDTSMDIHSSLRDVLASSGVTDYNASSSLSDTSATSSFRDILASSSLEDS